MMTARKPSHSQSGLTNHASRRKSIVVRCCAPRPHVLPRSDIATTPRPPEGPGSAAEVGKRRRQFKSGYGLPSRASLGRAHASTGTEVSAKAVHGFVRCRDRKSVV